MQHYVITMVLLLILPIAHATAAKNDSAITLKQVIVNVLEKNPQLMINDYDARAAAERIKQATLSTPVKVKIELQNFSGSDAYKADDSLESTLSFTKVLEFGNKQGLRGGLAKERRHLLHNQQAASRLDLLAETTRRFLHLVIDQHKLKIAQDTLALMQRTKASVSKRIRMGRSPRVDLRRATIAQARAELELEHAEHELITSRLKLTSMWGNSEPTLIKAQAALFMLPEIKDFSALAWHLQDNPDIIHYASQQKLADARLQLAKSQASRNIEFSAGVRHFSRNDDHAFIASAAIPLGSHSRARPFIDEARIQRQQQPYKFEQQKLALHSQLFEVYQELLHAKTAIDTLQDTIIPEATKILHDYDKGYNSGRYSLLELHQAQQTLLNARREAVMAAYSYHRHHIEIERLTGAHMPTTATAGEQK